jgi:hypothetical protein
MRIHRSVGEPAEGSLTHTVHVTASGPPRQPANTIVVPSEGPHRKVRAVPSTPRAPPRSRGRVARAWRRGRPSRAPAGPTRPGRPRAPPRLLPLGLPSSAARGEGGDTGWRGYLANHRATPLSPRTVCSEQIETVAVSAGLRRERKTTLNNGYLGSRNDEERSEMRYVV